MASSKDLDMEIIDDYNAVRLLINMYLIKKIKSRSRPVNLERFLDNVRKEFKNRDYNYPRKRILYTWKHLLDNYQYYKEKYTDEEAKAEWTYFSLMDNCFDDFKQPTSEKFKESRWMFFLIESLSRYKTIILKQGLTMDVLEEVEDDFQRAQNYGITQKDIYNQWVSLKRFYRQNQKTGYYKSLAKNHAYFAALKAFFEPEESVDRSEEFNPAANVSENELACAIESVMEQITETKKRKIDSEVPSKLHIDVLPKETATDSVLGGTTVPFTIVMHDILLQCFKRHKTKIQSLNGSLDEDILNEGLEEFQKLGYNVTRQEISNEWNDLSCRYELIKNTEHPEKWPYYSDMSYIYNTKDAIEESLFDEQDNQSTIGSIIVESVRKNHYLKREDYAVLTERLLNIYESNSKEFLEIKDILVERNLLREETNYLLSMFVGKKSRTKNLPE
ncbi:uncharacterized protein LOC108903427 [Anoplophora glabripennis]|uniref:uncharacterized protein LOC108903427 n=1 Tax=Anoplophora glabripennis TaxID=217634 RepID=UPI000873C802|nr:uncharacterized protein LOC108903427 [Anoplophora glabripennis]